jgi:hypothetical protein
MGADKLGISSGFTPTENVTDVFPEPAAHVQCTVGHNVTTAWCSALMSTACSVECHSSDATVYVLAKLAASEESDEDCETVNVASVTPATCSTGGLAHGRSGENHAAVSLVLWTTTPSSKAPVEATPTPSQRPFTDLRLDTMVSTRCLARCSNDIACRHLPTKLDVTPSIRQQGKWLRPLPWPSFVAKQRSTSRSGIIEPPLSSTTASSRRCAIKVSCAWLSTGGIKGICLELSSTEVLLNC